MDEISFAGKSLVAGAIEEMSRVLQEILDTKESLADLLCGRPVSRDLGFPLSFDTGTVIEISGEPKSGKTQLLMYLVLRAVLPQDWRGLALGQGMAVVIVDTDGSFRSHQLVHRMTQFVQAEFASRGKSAIPPAATDVAAMVMQAASAVFVFRPESVQSAMEVVDDLPKLLANTTSNAKKVAWIILDSLGAFFWQHRMHRGTTKPVGSLVASTLCMSRVFACGVIATNPFLFETQDEFVQGWSQHVDTRLHLTRSPVRPFLAEMTVEDALRDARMRMEIVDRGEFAMQVSSKMQHRALLKMFVTQNAIDVEVSGR